ncbi:MAG: hypothetical protein R8J94_21710 [Acidimicrobiia bacterium]|nr:hypothetical protein [Acidimicrobiia bacterium]
MSSIRMLGRRSGIRSSLRFLVLALVLTAVTVPALTIELAAAGEIHEALEELTPVIGSLVAAVALGRGMSGVYPSEFSVHNALHSLAPIMSPNVATPVALRFGSDQSEIVLPPLAGGLREVS